MNIQRFFLSLSSTECLAYYQGEITIIRTRTKEGKIIQFPANMIHQFVTVSGIKGEFQILYDNEHKLIGVEKIA